MQDIPISREKINDAQFFLLMMTLVKKRSTEFEPKNII